MIKSDPEILRRHLVALDGGCGLRKFADLCLNCLIKLSTKKPRKKYIYSNQRGDFCSEQCSQEYEQNIS